MILIFVALRSESRPIARRLSGRRDLPDSGLAGDRGRLADVPVTLVVTGMGMRRSRIAAAHAMDSLSSVDLVVSSGVAGGLRDDLVIGQTILSKSLLTCRQDSFQPEQVIEAPTQWRTNFAASLAACGISHAAGPTMTSRRPLMTAADKQQAYLQSGAISVDMESASIAFEANRRGLPFVCLRTILDTASEDVIAARMVDQNGHLRPVGAAKMLITSPRTIIGVAHLLRNLRRATHSLAVALETVAKHLPA